MKRQTRHIDTQFAVIGTGLAGCAASLAARAKGIEVAQFGHSGALSYTTGYLDLLGALDGTAQNDPWTGLARLRDQEPSHPLAGLSDGAIRAALTEFTGSLGTLGLTYTAPGARNLPALLPYGVTKPTASIPATMRPGLDAMAAGAPTLILDFEGLQGFSATEFRANMGQGWPGLRSARITFPGLDARPLFPEVMARALETATAQKRLADAIRPHLLDATYLGLPSILGIHAPDATRAGMEALLGVTLFEIPTIPPAVPGIRLRELFERELPGLGVRLDPQLKVARVDLGERPRLHLHGPMEDLTVDADAVLLATGRFLSGGLNSDRTRVHEPLLDLPVAQPAARDDWFSTDYFDPQGHALNRAGVETDADFRPLGTDGRPVHPRLFAAGSVLAHQDWVRQRCGAGLAIATAHAAVTALEKAFFTGS